MSKKFFAAVALITASAVASFAGDYVRLDLNCKNGVVFKVLTEKLPDGMSVNGKKKNTIFINLEKVREFALELEVAETGGDGDRVAIIPSIAPTRYPQDGQKAVVDCEEFEIAGESSPAVPCRIVKWQKMIDDKLTVAKGDKITIKAKFKNPTAE